MRVVTPEQMRAIDASAMGEFGIPGMVLMENAASAVVTEALRILDGQGGHDKQRYFGRWENRGMQGCTDRRGAGIVLVFAGTGNNGGDAFAAARLLRCKGIDVCVYLVGTAKNVTGDALTNLKILEKTGTRVTELLDEKDAGIPDLSPGRAKLILDGIFGTGLTREVRGLPAAVIEKANASGIPILSIDIPSGVDGKDGSIKGKCINAAATVTFCLPKVGLLIHPGCRHTGRLIVADIGIPAQIIDKHDIRLNLIERKMIAPMIPGRGDDSNKGTCGKVLLITGSTGMTGSGSLASRAALRTGAGLVYTGVPESMAHIYASAMAEPVIIPLKDDGKGNLDYKSMDDIRRSVEGMTVMAVGPGLGNSEGVLSVVKEIISESRIPLVMDADALNAVSRDTDILEGLSADTVITPHPGEMARLTGLSIEQIQSDRIAIAKEFAKKYKLTVVLKGSRTVVAQPGGTVFINTSGNPGMATAGAGDVLTGIIAGLIAQGVAPGDAAVAGVFLHGLAGDYGAAEKGVHGLLAGDIVEFIPRVIKELYEANLWKGYGLNRKIKKA